MSLVVLPGSVCEEGVYQLLVSHEPGCNAICSAVSTQLTKPLQMQAA